MNMTSEVTTQAPEESAPVVPDAPVSLPAEEEAAMKFTKLLPFVTKLADALPSKGGVVRVLRAMAEFPIGGREPRLLNEGERQLFHIMMELNGYKTTVVNSIMQKNATLEQARAEAQSGEDAELEKMKQTAVSTTAESDVTNG